MKLSVRSYRDVDLPIYSRAIFGAVLGLAVHGPWLSAGEDFTTDRIINEILITIVHGVQAVPEHDRPYSQRLMTPGSLTPRA